MLQYHWPRYCPQRGLHVNAVIVAPSIFHRLSCGLILFQMLFRFLTDANLGVEKLLVCKPLKGTRMSRTSLKASDVSSEFPEIVQPMGVLMVKGWTRGLALQIILMAAFDDDSFLQARNIF